MYTIKFFKLEVTKDLDLYKDKILEDFKFQLTTLENVKLFLGSEFYNQFKLHLEDDYFNHTRLDGIIITEDKEVIYKEINEGIFDNKFLIYKNSDGEIFYQVQNDVDIEDKDLVIVDKYNIAGHGYCFEEVDIKEEAIA